MSKLSYKFLMAFILWGHYLGRQRINSELAHMFWLTGNIISIHFETCKWLHYTWSSWPGNPALKHTVINSCELLDNNIEIHQKYNTFSMTYIYCISCTVLTCTNSAVTNNYWFYILILQTVTEWILLKEEWPNILWILEYDVFICIVIFTYVPYCGHA